MKLNQTAVTTFAKPYSEWFPHLERLSAMKLRAPYNALGMPFESFKYPFLALNGPDKESRFSQFKYFH